MVPKHVYEKLDADAIGEQPGDRSHRWRPVHDRRGQAGEFVRLARNPNWFGKKPAMDELIIRTFADSESQFQALQAGEVDAIDSVPVQLFTGIKEGTTSSASKATKAASRSSA